MTSEMQSLADKYLLVVMLTLVVAVILICQKIWKSGNCRKQSRVVYFFTDSAKAAFCLCAVTCVAMNAAISEATLWPWRALAVGAAIALSLVVCLVARLVNANEFESDIKMTLTFVATVVAMYAAFLCTTYTLLLVVANGVHLASDAKHYSGFPVLVLVTISMMYWWRRSNDPKESHCLSYVWPDFLVPAFWTSLVTAAWLYGATGNVSWQLAISGTVCVALSYLPEKVLGYSERLGQAMFGLFGGGVTLVANGLLAFFVNHIF